MLVPEYGEERVRLAPLPRARVSEEAPVDAFGGGAPAEQVRKAASGLSDAAFQIAQKERAKAIDTMTQEGYANLERKKNELLHGAEGKAGALSSRGKDALAIPDTFGKEFDTAAAEIENSLPDREARRIFSRMRMNVRNDFDGRINQHVAVESERFQDQVYDDLVSSLTDDAVANYSPARVKRNLGLLAAATAEQAARKGLSTVEGAPVREAMWKQIENKMHVGVINRLIAQGNNDDARDYFKANKSGISGMSMDGIEAAIKITDKLKQKDMYLESAKLLDKSPMANPKNVIPGFDNLSPEQRDALKRRYGNEQSPSAHHEFYSLSTAELAQMDRADFETRYWSRFDQEHRRKAETYWKSAIDAAKAGRDGGWKSMRGDHDMVLTALKKAKLIPVTGKLSDGQAEIAQRFEDHIDDQFKAFFHENKRMPSDEQKQVIIRRAMLDKVYVEKSWSVDPQLPIGTLTDEEIDQAYVPMASIKRAERLMLVNLARAQGVIAPVDRGGPDDDRAMVVLQNEIERAYAAAASKKANRADLISILKGER